MKKITYKTSGVDIRKADDFVKSISGMVGGTLTSAVLRNPGAFGSLFALDVRKYKDPVLVSSTDGVGTKLLVAQALNKHDTVGIDLVAMNVNDVLCTGARPLFFLDYIACGKVKSGVLKDVVKGIARGCHQAGCSLIGGETAEMPGMYRPDEYDLAGFAVGVVDRKKIIDGSTIKAGDRILGLASSGAHSNGYSLIRKVFSVSEQKKYAKEILAPTRIYVKPVLEIIRKIPLKGIAHITGGAFYQKMTKIVPTGKCFAVNKSAWPVPELFQMIQKRARINDQEMFTTFNMGIGMVMVMDRKYVSSAQRFLKNFRISSWEIGEVVKGSKKIYIKDG